MKKRLPEGFIARPARLEDADIVSDLWNARSQWVQQTTPHSKATVRKQWDDSRFCLATDSLLVFDPRTTLIGYAHIRESRIRPSTCSALCQFTLSAMTKRGCGRRSFTGRRLKHDVSLPKRPLTQESL